MKKPLLWLSAAALLITSCSKKSQPAPVQASQTVTVTTFAGGGAGTATNGTGIAASFDAPQGLAIDSSGNVYVADYSNNIIRMITPVGVVSTLPTDVVISRPESVATDLAGNIYFCENGSTEIYILRAGTVTSISSTVFTYPFGVASTVAGNLYVADFVSNLIDGVTNPLGTPVVTTLAGGGLGTATNGTGTATSFNEPYALATDIAGNIYVADALNNLIRKVTPAGVVTTLAGGGTGTATNGTGAVASFNRPVGVAADAAGNVYVSDSGNNLIRKITSAGVVTTLAGNGTIGAVNGTGASAEFTGPRGITVDAKGQNIYVSDSGNNLIRKITISN